MNSWNTRLSEISEEVQKAREIDEKRAEALKKQELTLVIPANGSKPFYTNRPEKYTALNIEQKPIDKNKRKKKRFNKLINN